MYFSTHADLSGTGYLFGILPTDPRNKFDGALTFTANGNQADLALTWTELRDLADYLDRCLQIHTDDLDALRRPAAEERARQLAAELRISREQQLSASETIAIQFDSASDSN